MRWRKTVTVVGLATLLALIWADRRETRRELRRLADRLDAQVTLPVPQRSAPVVSSVASAPAESDRASYPPYIIETPELILIDPTRIAPTPLYQVDRSMYCTPPARTYSRQTRSTTCSRSGRMGRLTSARPTAGRSGWPA